MFLYDIDYILKIQILGKTSLKKKKNNKNY